MSRRLFLLCAVVTLLAVPLQTRAQSAPALAPNDPRAEQQWAISKIGLECAWQHTQGSPDVTVAVIDSGVDPTHPDLVAALRDDGYNAVDNTNDPTDTNGHGTHVAGIIAATINNGEGVAGVAGGGTRILPIRVMAADGSGSNADIVAGIEYAIEKRVQVINMSLGSLLPLDSDDIVAAIRRAHDAGILVVVAAGNSYVPLPNFAFGIDQYALVVAATDDGDHKTDFSNYGPWVAVSAPGDGILSTMPTYDVYLTSMLPPEERFNKNYDFMSGTSQATPIVSGVAALLFAAHPDWTAEQVKAEIQRTATDISALNPAKRFGPITYFDPNNLGAGRINACDALGGPISSSVIGAAGGFPLWPVLLVGAGVLVLAVALVLLRRRRAVPPLANPSGLPPQAMGQPFAPPPQQAYQPQPSPPGATPPYQPAPGPRVPSQPIGTHPAAPASGAPAAAQPAWGKLTVVEGPEQGRFFLLRGAMLVLGRDPSTAIVIGDPTVSRQHLQITRQGQETLVEDLGSAHGTYLNGNQLRAPRALRNNDMIRVGTTTLRYEG